MESIFYHAEFSNLTHFITQHFHGKKLNTFTLFYFCQIRIVISQYFLQKYATSQTTQMSKFRKNWETLDSEINERFMKLSK